MSRLGPSFSPLSVSVFSRVRSSFTRTLLLVFALTPRLAPLPLFTNIVAGS